MKLRLGLVIFLLASIAAHADKASGPPPLIDRELLFGNPEIAAAQLSPDGKYIAFLKPWKDTRNVWVKNSRTSRSARRALLTTETKRPFAGYSLEPRRQVRPLCERHTTATRTSTSMPSIPARCPRRAPKLHPRAT